MHNPRFDSRLVKTVCLTILLVAIASNAFAQDEDHWKCTEPTFGLKKVQALIKKHENAGEGEGDAVVFTDKEYKSLTFEEKFTYAMINGEGYTQNCDPDTNPDSISGDDHRPKLFGGVSDGVEDSMRNRSERQEHFLTRNRARVVQLLRRTIRAKNEVGDNLKGAIDLVNAYELIPDVVSVYEHDKDLKCIELLLSLMRQGKYKPFLASATYHKLYGPQSNSKSYIIANQANIDLTIKRAREYYQSKMR